MELKIERWIVVKIMLKLDFVLRIYFKIDNSHRNN